MRGTKAKLNQLLLRLDSTVLLEMTVAQLDPSPNA